MSYILGFTIGTHAAIFSSKRGFFFIDGGKVLDEANNSYIYDGYIISSSGPLNSSAIINDSFLSNKPDENSVKLVLSTTESNLRPFVKEAKKQYPGVNFDQKTSAMYSAIDGDGVIALKSIVMDGSNFVKEESVIGKLIVIDYSSDYSLGRAEFNQVDKFINETILKIKSSTSPDAAFLDCARKIGKLISKLNSNNEIYDFVYFDSNLKTERFEANTDLIAGI